MRFAAILSSIVLICLLVGCSDEESSNGTAPVAEPDTPTGLAVTHIGLTTLQLTWDTVDEATEYNLYRSDTEMGTYAEIYSGTTTGGLDNTVLYASTYWYKVSAENSSGESDRSTAVSGTTYTPAGFNVTQSPSGSVDYPFNHTGTFNSKPLYESDPVGLRIIVPSGGDQAGLWVFYDQIEGMNLYYHPTVSDYPLPTGWLAVSNDASTSTLLTPFGP